MKIRIQIADRSFLSALIAGCFLFLSLFKASAATLVQEFYLPMPEQQIYQANTAIISGTGQTNFSTFSIVVTGDGTAVYYDQWEDGYEINLGSPAQSTTKVWGDGNNVNGICPGFTNDPSGLVAGTVITLTNNVPLPRNPSVVLWDARDRVAATKALVISRAAWPIPTGPVFAGAVGVLSTLDYGTNYVSPVGQDQTNVNLFKYVGMFIMAAQNNTAITLDPNGNGVGTTSIVLNQGESYLINGGIKKGGRITASKPVQADLLVGRVGASYASDWFTLYPVEQWDDTYYTPVSSASSGTQPAYVYLFNPSTNAITINYSTRAGGGSFAIPGTNGVYQFQMPIGSGASFTSVSGQNFFAICTVAANNSSDTAYNWGFTLVPKAALTTEATVGWGPGSADGTVNGSPVWVTTLGATTVYVDYKGDKAGPLTDSDGGKYDTNFTVVNLQSLKIYDPSKNQTGMRIYTVDGTLLTAAWGEDADKASPGNPYIDAGTTVLPFPVPVLIKTAAITNDTAPVGLSIGDTIQYTVQVDNKGLLPLGNTIVIDAPSTNLTYVTNSTTWNGQAIPDSVSGTPFPLDAPGFTIPLILSRGSSTFQYQFQVNAAGVLSNSVNIGGTPISTFASLNPPPTNGVSVNIRFTDTNGATVALYAAGANVFVTLTNAVGNTSSNSIQTLLVTVTDPSSGDAETITLTETGVNTGVFRNIGGLPTSLTLGIVSQNGILKVAPGDTLNVSYTEPTYGSSSSATAAIQIPAQTKQLYLSVNGSTNGTQALNRVNPVAAGHPTTRSSIDIGGGSVTTNTSTIGVDGAYATNAVASSLTFNYTTGSGTNRLMLVTVGIQQGNGALPTISGVTYNGTSLNLVTNATKTASNPKYGNFLYSLVNPPAGTFPLVVSGSGGDSCLIGVTTFTNVSQTAPLSATNSVAAGTTITVNSATNQLVFGAIYNNGTATLAAGQSAATRWSRSAGGYAGMGNTVAGSNAVSTSITWQESAYLVGVSINPATTSIVNGSGGPATNVTSFVQTPVFCSAFTMPSNNVITLTNYITLTNGSFSANPAVIATLRYGSTPFLTLTNPVYSSASNTLVWSQLLPTNVTVPASAAITCTISNAVPNTAFHIDYDSVSKPSKISLPAATVIAIDTLGIYDAPYPGGSIVTTPVAGTTLYVRAAVSDPFGSYDITSLGLAFTAPDTNNNFSVTLNDTNVVASDSCSKTYEYVWNTGPATGGYNVAATANEGTEGVTAVASTGVTTIFLDLGTPSTTEFTGGNNGGATNSYLANSSVCVRVTDLNRDTNAATAQSIIATVSSSSGDSEILTLTETGTNTGIFTACIATSTNAPVVPNDSTLTAPVGSILTASYTDPTDVSDSTSATANIQPLPGVPGVVMNKTIVSPSGGQVGVGQPVVYNLQVVNVGSTTLPSLKITDTFTASKLSYTSASVTPDVIGAGTLTWNNLGAFSPGQSTNITVTFTTLATGTATNSATANGSTATNSSSVTLAVNSAAVNVVKTLLSPTNQTVSIQSNVVFRITVQNVGNTAINLLPMEDTFSGAYYQYVSATIPPSGTGFGTLIWTNLASSLLGTNATITNDITMKVVGQGSPANNTATVDFATDVFGNEVPTASSTVGVTTSSAGISGRVYNDPNQLGAYTNGMTGLSGVTLELYTDPNGDGNPADGALVQVTTTDGGGYYELLNLTMGNYVVVETDLPGYSSSAPVNNRLSLNLTSLVTFTNNFFFDYIPAPSVYSTFSGTVYNDVLGTGVNTSQAGLGNVTIDLVQDVNSNGIVDLGEPVASSATTDTNGNYFLSGITPGHYVLLENDSYGYYSTGDSQPPNDNQIAFVTTNGIVSTNNSFFDRLSPVANDDTNSTSYFAPVLLSPLANDVSPNGDTLTISNATSAFGIVVINPGATNLTFTPTNTGTVTISYTILDQHGGSASATITVGVSLKPLTITANSTSKTYGQTVTFAGTEFSVVGLTNGDSVTSVTLTSAGAVSTAIVGSYSIIPSAAIGSGLANYAITYATNGLLTVNPALLGVTANSTNRLYNTANPAFTYTASGFVNGDTLSVLSGSPSLTTPAILSSPAGTYPINATNGTLSATNYVFSFTNGVLTVALSSPVVIWPVPTNIVYGTPLSALQNNATSSVPGTAVYNPTNGTVLDAGTNTLSVVYTPTDTNYAATNLSVLLVVTPAPLSVTASNVARLYGQVNPALGGTITGLHNGDNITATYASVATTNSPVGGYPIVPALVDPNSRLVNYVVTTNNGTLTVSQAVLGVTANSTNRLYNTANPVFTASYSGFVNGETASVLSGAPDLSTPAILSSPVGTYPINATNGTLSATNYAFSFTNGTLTVLGGTYGITWTNPASIVYGTLLGTNQNNASATVGGSYVYNPTNGVILPVGTNTLTVLFTPSDTNYAATNVSVQIVVTPAPLTITADNQGKVYGAALNLGTTAFTSSGLVNSETIGSVTLTSAGAPTNAAAGTYAIVPSAATGGTFNPANYSLTYSNGVLTVSQATLTVTANSTNKIYGAANPAFTASYSGFVNGDTTGVLTGTPSLTTTATTNSGVGGYTITATNGTLSAANYSFIFVNGTLTVNAATLTVTANNTNRLYNTANPAFTASYSGFVNGETTGVLSGSPSLTTTAILSSPAGVYPITSTNGTLSAANYAFSFVNGTLTISGGSYGIIWTNPASIVYGTLLGTNQNNASATVNGTYTYNATNGVLLPAGTNTLSVVFTPTDTNFASTNLSVTLVVTPAPLTITANSTNKVYNTTLALGTTAFTSSGLVNSETIGGVTLSSAGTIASAPVGVYPITPSNATGGTFNPANYSLTYSNGTLTVLGAGYTATWPTPTNIVYGTVLGTNQNNASATIGGTFTYNPTNGVVLPAGTNILTVLFTPSDTNFAATNLSVPLIVTPAPLTITADNANKVYGTMLTLGSGQTAFTSSGLVNGDSVTSVTLASAGASGAAPVGTYPMVPSLAVGSGLTNYNIGYSNGTLTVLAGNYGITWTNPASIVYGTPLGTNQNNASATVSGGYVYNPTNGVILPVGTNTLSVVFTPGDTNYPSTNLTVKLLVTPAPLSVTASNVARLYGQPNPALGGTLTGLQNGDNITATYATSATTNSPVGGYPIVPTLSDPNSRLANYTVTTNNGTLTVNPATLTVAANNTNKIYGAANPAFTANYVGFVNGETTGVLTGTPSLTTTATTNSGVGGYPIVATNGTLSAANYTFSFVNGTLTVGQATVTVTANNTNRLYNTANPAFTASYSGFVNGETTSVLSGAPSLTTTAILSSPAGVYPITATNGTLSAANYGFTFVNGALTISGGSYGITWTNPASIVYGTLLGTNQNNASATVNGTYTYNPTNGVLLPAGTNTLSVVFTPTDTNYAATNASVQIVVTPALLTVTANSTNKVYGAANPAFTASYSGFVNGETNSVLSGSPSLTTTATTNSAVGGYTITATNGTLSAANYVFSFVNGTLTIGQASLSVTANDQVKNYGTTLTLGAGQTAFTSSGLKNGETIGSVTLTASGGTAAFDAPGTYTLTPSAATGGTFSLANYNVTYFNGSLIVTQSVSADLAVFKTGPASAMAGSNLVYSITVTNLGPAAATNLVVKDWLPAGFSYVSSTPSGATVASNVVTWSVAKLAANAKTNFTVTARSLEGGTFTNLATATSDAYDPNSGNSDGSSTNSQVRTVVSPRADVAVFKTGGTNVYAGGIVTYTITVTNLGPSTASNVVVMDQLPPNTTYLGASNSPSLELIEALSASVSYVGTNGSPTVSNSVVYWPAFTLTNGATASFTICLQVPVSGSFTNIALSTSSTADPVVTNNNGSAKGSRVVTKIVPSADVVVRLTGPANAIAGSNFVYTITITNAGPSVSSNIVVSDSLPLGLTFVSASNNGKVTNSLVTWPAIKSLAVGGVTNFTLTVKAPAAGTFTNLVSALAVTFDPNTTNNSGILPDAQAVTQVGFAQFSIRMGTPVLNPQTGLFEESVTVTNTGNVTILGFRLFVGGLPAGVTLYNAGGTANGLPYADYNFPVDPSNAVTMILEFYNSTRLPFTHTLYAEPILPAPVSVSGTNNSALISTNFMDTRIEGDPRFVIEFKSVPGKTYTVIYSSDLLTWKVATPSVHAVNNVTQWYDDGPPKTESKPGSVSARYYRVIQY